MQVCSASPAATSGSLANTGKERPRRCCCCESSPMHIMGEESPRVLESARSTARLVSRQAAQEGFVSAVAVVVEAKRAKRRLKTTSESARRRIVACLSTLEENELFSFSSTLLTPLYRRGLWASLVGASKIFSKKAGREKESSLRWPTHRTVRPFRRVRGSFFHFFLPFLSRSCRKKLYLLRLFPSVAPSLLLQPFASHVSLSLGESSSCVCAGLKSSSSSSSSSSEREKPARTASPRELQSLCRMPSPPPLP